MTNQREKSTSQVSSLGGLGGPVAPAFPGFTGLPRRNSAQAIAAGLDWVFSMQRNGHWADFNLPGGESDIWVTAYVLARLGEVPPAYLSDAMRLRVCAALDWLINQRGPDGAWGHSSCVAEGDADSTSWAVLALRRHGCRVPSTAFDLLRRCQQTDGGTAARPGCSSTAQLDQRWTLSAPDVTAVAANALRMVSPEVAAYLAAALLENKRPVPGSRLSSRVYPCSAVLDVERSSLPPSLLDKLRVLANYYTPEGAFEHALLLRCLLQLRLQRAWWVAASLRRMQQADGSWMASARLHPPAAGAGQPCLDQTRVFTTVTSVSALVMGESQPGLYFGSDMPQARRLYES